MPDSPAVAVWRDTFRLNLTKSWKHDVDITVTDIELWKQILLGWFWIDTKGKRHKKAPGIKNLLTEYERLAMKRDEDRKRREAVRERDRERVSVRNSDSPMFTLSRTADGWTR